MSRGFDPYHKWLGIPPEEQPPHHYRLLGLRLFEDDPVVIEHAADARMAHLRTIQAGPHGSLSQKLLNEVAAARVCLLTAERKADYDKSLRTQSPTPVAPPPTVTAPPLATSPAPAIAPPISRQIVRIKSAGDAQKSSKARRRVPSMFFWVVIAVGATAVLGSVLWRLNSRRQRPHENVAQQSLAPQAGQPTQPAPVPLSEPTHSGPSIKPEATQPPGPAGPAEPDGVVAEPVRSKTEPPGQLADESASVSSDALPVTALTEPESFKMPQPKSNPRKRKRNRRSNSLPESSEVPQPEPAPPPPPADSTASRQPLPEPSPKPASSEEPTGAKPPPSLDSSQRTAAIDAGLKWLAGCQERGGNWLFVNAPNPGTRTDQVGATSLALLPFLLAGHTHKAGDYKDVVMQGIQYLGGQAKLDPKTGLDLRGEGGDMYTHALAALVLCEAQGRTKDRSLRVPAEQAVRFILWAQDPKGGGWRYRPHQPGDTSVLGWQVSALLAAKRAKIPIPPQTLSGIDAFLDSVQANQGASYGYDQPGGGKPTQLGTTAIGLFCRTQRGWERDHPALKEGAERIAAHGPSDNVYFNLHATCLLRQYGGSEWTEWKNSMRPWLLSRQQKVEPEAGSWFVEAPKDENFVAPNAGRLGVTAFCLMTLLELDEP